MFHIGQVVVCIRQFKGDGPDRDISYPQKGCAYTVRDIIVLGDAAGIRLEEIINAPRQNLEGYFEPAFVTRNFRPAVKTDISIFTEMLNKTRVDA